MKKHLLAYNPFEGIRIVQDDIKEEELDYLPRRLLLNVPTLIDLIDIAEGQLAISSRSTIGTVFCIADDDELVELYDAYGIQNMQETTSSIAIGF